MEGSGERQKRKAGGGPDRKDRGLRREGSAGKKDGVEVRTANTQDKRTPTRRQWV